MRVSSSIWERSAWRSCRCPAASLRALESASRAMRMAVSSRDGFPVLPVILSIGVQF